MRLTLSTALVALLASLALVAGPASAAPAGRNLTVEPPTPAAKPAKVEDPTAALIRAERARLRELQAQRKADREARAGARRQAELVRIRERIAALEARPAGK